jgi:hypothetical protein
MNHDPAVTTQRHRRFPHPAAATAATAPPGGVLDRNFVAALIFMAVPAPLLEPVASQEAGLRQRDHLLTATGEVLTAAERIAHGALVAAGRAGWRWQYG